MEFSQLQILIDKYLNGLATEEEKKVVDEWYESCEAQPGLSQTQDSASLSTAMTMSFSRIKKDLNF